ncbi:MAG: hypothetical protein NZ899_05945 [Thermoguttaceae bacterium]|nr:hypothetical protein [Thermoguttaceae bacterium]MDW8079483.1 hypothetical protein [Thermoguttaceae bacterium]
MPSAGPGGFVGLSGRREVWRKRRLDGKLLGPFYLINGGTPKLQRGTHIPAPVFGAIIEIDSRIVAYRFGDLARVSSGKRGFCRPEPQAIILRNTFRASPRLFGREVSLCPSAIKPGAGRFKRRFAGVRQ